MLLNRNKKLLQYNLNIKVKKEDASYLVSSSPSATICSNTCIRS